MSHNFPKKSVVKETYFGNFSASKHLSQLINQEDNYTIRKSSILWTKYCRGLKEIKKSNIDLDTKNKIARLWLNDFLVKISQKSWNDKIKSYFSNVMKSQFNVRLKNG